VVNLDTNLWTYLKYLT